MFSVRKLSGEETDGSCVSSDQSTELSSPRLSEHDLTTVVDDPEYTMICEMLKSYFINDLSCFIVEFDAVVALSAVRKSVIMKLVELAEDRGMQRIMFAINRKNPNFSELVRLFLIFGFELTQTTGQLEINRSGEFVVLELDL
mmetsp:Transcript_45267/g.52033  ORF Transcript_45267/g.52033 Transcript_45267/m.52033 type:complete len:143 (-) Transcript_45267:520-948(-)